MLSKLFLIKRGKCCGNRCLMCPYEKRHSGQSREVRTSVMDNLENWEKEELGVVDKTYTKKSNV